MDPYVPHCKEIFSPTEPPTFPNSIYLQGAVDRVFLYPQSQFYFDIGDYNRSFTLRPFPETICFPTRAAIFDSHIDVHSDPPSGRNLWVLRNLLSHWSAVLFRGVVFGHGPLDAERRGIMESLRPENRPYFEAMVWYGIFPEWLPDTRPHRKEILHSLGCIFFSLPSCCGPNVIS